MSTESPLQVVKHLDGSRTYTCTKHGDRFRVRAGMAGCTSTIQFCGCCQEGIDDD